MQKDLGLSNQQFLNIVMMFCMLDPILVLADSEVTNYLIVLGYVLLELPVCLTLRYIPARFAFGVPIMAFGTFVLLMAFCHSYASLTILRVVVGFAEVFVNNAFIFITLWYKPEEVALRTGK